MVTQAQIDKFIRHADYLEQRWQDEQDYEDFEQYRQSAADNFPLPLREMTEDPFRIVFEGDGERHEFIVGSKLTHNIYRAKEENESTD